MTVVCSSVGSFSKPGALMKGESGLRKLGAVMSDTELQGPTNWSISDLKRKYRSEDNRNRAWLSFLERKKEAVRKETEQGIVIPLVTVTQHPLHGTYHEIMHHLNDFAKQRARQRNKKKVNPTFNF